jgi:hypothetical protein
MPKVSGRCWLTPPSRPNGASDLTICRRGKRIKASPPCRRAPCAAAPGNRSAPALIFAAAVVFVVLLGAILLLASNGAGPAAGGQLQAAAATATSLSAFLPSPTLYQRPTMPATWTPAPVEVATKTPAPTDTPRPTLFPTFSPEQLNATYWDGDGYDYTMWDAQFSDGGYGRFDLFPINVWIGGYNGVEVTAAHEVAFQNALNGIGKVAPITRVEERIRP